MQMGASSDTPGRLQLTSIPPRWAQTETPRKKLHKWDSRARMRTYPEDLLSPVLCSLFPGSGLRSPFPWPL